MSGCVARGTCCFSAPRTAAKYSSLTSSATSTSMAHAETAHVTRFAPGKLASRGGPPAAKAKQHKSHRFSRRSTHTHRRQPIRRATMCHTDKHTVRLPHSPGSLCNTHLFPPIWRACGRPLEYGTANRSTANACNVACALGSSFLSWLCRPERIRARICRGRFIAKPSKNERKS